MDLGPVPFPFRPWWLGSFVPVPVPVPVLSESPLIAAYICGCYGLGRAVYSAGRFASLCDHIYNLKTSVLYTEEV